jgi:hypothetical protein
MRLGAIALGACILLCGSWAVAANFVSLTVAGEPGPSDALVQVRTSEPSTGTIRIEYDIEGYYTSPVSVGTQTFQAIGLPEEAHLLNAGLPELPLVARSVIIPDDAEMNVRVVSADYVDFANVDVVPSKGNLLRTVDPARVPYTFAAAYAQDAWYPSAIATQDDPYILRDLRGMVVRVQPFQYNAARHTLRVYRHLVVEVETAGPGRINVLQRTGPTGQVSAEFFGLYGDQFVNFDPSRYAPIDEVGEMIIIAYDDFAAAMQPLVDWKNQEGVPTTLFTKSQVGTTYQAFQTFIQNYYNAHNLAFVLLVGDNAQIPSPSNGGAPADPVYSLVAGSDNYPDLFVGRFSAENAGHAEVQVTKSIEYEQLPLAGGAWYRRGIGIGSGQGAGQGDDGEADYIHIGVIRTKLLGFTYTGVDTIYEVSGYPSTAQAVLNAVNNGRSIINYCGHGSVTSWSTTGFSNSHVAQLVNYNKLPWINSVACVNGAFQSGTCFAESWLRAFKDGEPTGAVGMYASTVNMSWAPPMAAQDETIDLLVAQEKRTVGALLMSGSCQMMDEYGGGGVSEFKNWHVFGDPSLRVRSAAPGTLTVVHDDNIESGATTFSVTVPGVEGALCGLSKDGAYLGSAFTGANGVAVITIVGTLPEDAVTLTVSYFNKIPYFAELQVGPSLIPLMGVDPLSFTVELPLGQVRVDSLLISNVGMEGSILNYNVTVMPPMMNPWVQVDRVGGDVPAGDTDIVLVTFDTNVVGTGEYHAQIVVSGEDVEAVSVPVTLIAGDASAVTDRGERPGRLALETARPNPSAGMSAVMLALPNEARVELGVYDASGRRVRTLLSGTLSAGYHPQVWDGRDDGGRSLPTGLYLYKLNAAGQRLSQKVMLLR